MEWVKWGKQTKGKNPTHQIITTFSSPKALHLPQFHKGKKKSQLYKN